MEKIASDKAKVNGTKARELKQEVEIHNSTIASFGKPDEELEVHKTELAGYESSLQVKIAERDQKKLILANQQAAQERHAKLLASITTLKSKKEAAEQNRANQQAIVDSSAIILDGKAEIEGKVAEYKTLVEKEKELSAEAALYSSKLSEFTGLETQIQRIEMQLTELRTKLQGEMEKKAALEEPVDETAIRNNAAEYEKYTNMLKQMKDLQTKWLQAKYERDRKAYAVDSKKAYINQEMQRLNGKKADLERRTELLHNSGCSNTDNAECRFLADAMDAKKQLPVVENEINAFQEEQNKLLQELIADVDEAEKATEDVGYDANLLTEYSQKVKLLADAPTQLKMLEERTNEIALITASIEHLQSNISEAKKRLAEVKLKGIETEKERDRYAKAFEEHTIVSREIISLEPWLEKEKQLPVAEERNLTAKNRVLELTEELLNIDTEIAEKQAEAEKEVLAMSGMEELIGIVTKMNADVDALNSLVKEKQMKIGALQQKSEQIAKLKQEIAKLQQKEAEYAKEATDYEVLKVAFSQSGVPHQIIRSIIPQLTAASNTILGQMTGGKMGVEFKLQHSQKNKKEKASLDIFIEEYGKAALPYLSKSGGEKVKASLSVILALAEIKSSSAGIQLGMLFIDEPPFLDSDGIEAYCDALEAIQSRYQSIKIMAITHDPTMKARFPQSLDVIKTDEGSKVIY